MKKEPSILQIEQLLEAFRKNGGSDAEISLLVQDIIRDFKPEIHREPREVFRPEEVHESIKRIKDFKNDPASPIKQAVSLTWHHWYVKYPTIFISSFLIIFLTLNFPLLANKIMPVKDVKKETVIVKELVTPEMDKSAPLEPGEVVPSTPTLVVPKIGVTAPIVFVNSIVESDIQEGLRSGVVHYAGTAEPGKVGNSFITGHSSNYWWEKGGFNYVFANLEKMAVGDQAKIYYNGNKYLYQISEIKVVEPTDLSVLDQTSKPTMTLMTCTPPGTSWKRLIVKFDQIAPVYKPSVIVEKEVEAPKVSILPRVNNGNIFDDFKKFLGL